MHKKQGESIKQKSVLSLNYEYPTSEIQKTLQEFKKKQQKWQYQKKNYQKSLTLLNLQLTKTKQENIQLLKKIKQNHKRISTSSYPEQRTFIFNQTNISSLQYYHPSIKTPKNITSQQTLTNNNFWGLKLSIKLHLDSIRTVCWTQNQFIENSTFKNYETQKSPILVSGGDDCLVKIYKDKQTKFIIRQHMGPIYSIISSPHGFLSAGAQGVIRNWNYQNIEQNPFLISQGDFHNDSIWQIKLKDQFLLTSSSDFSHKLIKIYQGQLKQVKCIKGSDCPTSIDFIDRNKFVVGSANNNNLKIYDLQKGILLQKLSYQGRSNFNQSNKIIYDDIHKLIISAHQDKSIRIFDTNSKKCIKQIAAHSDSVTGLGLKLENSQLMSCGHDGSFRIWDLKKYRCVNEIAVHMKKYDESALCLSINKWQKIVAVSGADGSVKFISSEP